MHCGSRYTPEPKLQGYPDEVRKQALEMYVDGINLRRIGRHLGLHHSTVSLWVKAYAANLPEAPKPEEVIDAEMDELFTFIGDKKTESTSSPS
jgi:transposase-like protein